MCKKISLNYKSLGLFYLMRNYVGSVQSFKSGSGVRVGRSTPPPVCENQALLY